MSREGYLRKLKQIQEQDVANQEVLQRLMQIEQDMIDKISKNGIWLEDKFW